MAIPGDFPLFPALAAAFSRAYGRPPALAARAPGRVNLIGEHTDYNEGWVLPAAIQFEVQIVAAPRADASVWLHALDLSEIGSFELTARGRPNELWLRYPQGVAVALQEAGHALTGLDVAYMGDVPVGSGLSSSAAVEVAFVRAFAAAVGLELGGAAAARLAQQAETEFVGVPSGIMDQFASALGRAGNAILLDCRSLQYRYVPLRLPGVVIAVIDTGVHRELARSEYGRRRAECDAAVAQLRKRLPAIRSLRDVSPKQLNENRDLLDDVLLRRARHVVEEDVRTLAAAEALEHGDAARVGTLMRASHASLRDLYEVSSPELNAVVDIANGVSGVLGARMTGAGFGGSAVALLEERAWDSLAVALAANYSTRSGRAARLYRCRAADGAQTRSVPELRFQTG